MSPRLENYLQRIVPSKRWLSNSTVKNLSVTLSLLV